ncbi:hypothetical protein K474DRAFT_1662731 [Panus rudis PR-1116 ss-1]|nr:hypothetical protein K474DRAFT_1662731 [Panus rudis PR-1116 ss-1]
MPSQQPAHKLVQMQSKRRRLNSTSSHLGPSPCRSALTGGEKLQIVTCNCCRRLLPAASTADIKCLRCAEYTCPTCSRTCESWSTPSGSSSPSFARNSMTAQREIRPMKRLPLRGTNAPNYASSVSPPVPHAHAGQRRRRDETTDDIDVKASDDIEGETIAGCGRRVCRHCCIENPSSHTSFCFDCYAKMKERNMDLSGTSDGNAIVTMTDL